METSSGSLHSHLDEQQLLPDQLTQEEVAQCISVLTKALRNWEGGSHYPSEANLQKLIELYLLR